MFSRMIGAILLVIAMSIGGGLLALPVVTAGINFWYTAGLLVIVWFITTWCSLFILEVSLWLPEDTNLIAMAQKTLGLPGKILTWVLFLLMLYCIMCVYISGGGDLISGYLNAHGLCVSHQFSAVLFSLLLGAVVWHGVTLIDYTNRALMFVKLGSYVVLLVLMAPLIKASPVPGQHPHLYTLSLAIMPAIFSFGYAIVIPSLRSYLRGHVPYLKRAILIGSLIPLLCFICWIYTVQGVIAPADLQQAQQSGQVVSTINTMLAASGGIWVSIMTHLFTTICLLTAFLAVSLSLSDFIADGLSKPKKGFNKWLIYSLTFAPPLLIVMIKPTVFIRAIHYAGVLVVLLSMLLPTIMVWRGRTLSVSKESSYRVIGGFFSVGLMLCITTLLLFFAIFKSLTH